MFVVKQLDEAYHARKVLFADAVLSPNKQYQNMKKIIARFKYSEIP